LSFVPVYQHALSFPVCFSQWGIENFYIVFPYSIKERVTRTGIFQWVSKYAKNAIAQINEVVARCPSFFILVVPSQFRYPVWGQEPGSLTHRHRRLLTQKRIFSPAYYQVGTSGKALKCHIISAGL
jgi:hypothetical protein